MKKSEESAFSYGYKRTDKDFTFTFNFSFEALAILVFAVVLAVIGLAHACGRQPAPATVDAPPHTRETELGSFPVLPVAVEYKNDKPETAIVKPKKPALKKVVFEGDNGARDEKYIKRFQNIAILEMQKFGIPASVKMAQGLLESQGGQSELTINHNNHFGIKCHAKECPPGHCVNYKDDSHKDFFRAFGNSWESWRAHSLLLQGERYAKLKGLPYKDFAHGLKKCGYATDKRYAYKIIALIHRYDLTRLDKGIKF